MSASTNQNQPSVRKLIVVVFLLGAICATVVVLALMATGLSAAGPTYASTFGHKPFVILTVSSVGAEETFLPYYNYSSSASYPYHYGMMAFGTGDLRLNVTSRISGTISSTNGIDLFIDSPNNLAYSLEPSLSNNRSTLLHGYLYTTGNVISTTIDLVLPAGNYGFVLLNPNSVPSNLTSGTRIVATPIS